MNKLVKRAMSPRVPTRQILGLAAAGGIALPAFMDAVAHGIGKPSFGDYLNSIKNADISRKANAVFNAGLGFGGAAAIATRNPAMIYPGAALMALAPAKDLMISLQRPAHLLPDYLNQKPSSNLPNWLMAGAAASALPLGYLAYKNIQKSVDDRAKAESRNTVIGNNGSVRVALPPAAPGLPSTIVELPIERVNISQNLTDKLGRDVRRKLRYGVSSRTFHKTSDGLQAPESMEFMRN